MVYLFIAISAVLVLGLSLLERRAGVRNTDRAINVLAWLLNIAAGFTVYTLFSEWRGGKGNRLFTPGDFELDLGKEFPWTGKCRPAAGKEVKNVEFFKPPTL